MGADAIINDVFQRAMNDYFYLKNNHYPEKGSLKLVGDRYLLSMDQRTTLYRGVCSREEASKRSLRIIASPTGSLAIDGYNVLFTLYNYRLGRFVFISNDGICRDAGSLFGKISNESLFAECASLLMQHLVNFGISSITMYLDSSVSLSKHHQTLMLGLAKKKNINIHAALSTNADRALLSNQAEVIATSDSVVIDGLDTPILDIPKTIIEENYKHKLPDLRDLLK